MLSSDRMLAEVWGNRHKDNVWSGGELMDAGPAASITCDSNMEAGAGAELKG